jgi:ABC-2 type transport system ATP-binding protein
VVIIDRGRISAEGSPARLKASVGGESLNLLFDTRQLAERALSELADMGERIQLDREMLRLYVGNAAEAVPAVLNRLQQAAIPSISLTLSQPTLDDVFLQATGHRLETQAMPPGAGPETGSKAGTAVMSRDE